MTAEGALRVPDLGGATPWTDLAQLPERPREFSFVLLSDRTGMARPGVFEQGVDIANLLRPDFAIQLGDSIEGYTTDADEVDRQWNEFDAIIGRLDVPLFRVPGNHDVSNELMRSTWLRRHGALYYHFVHHDVLFIVLDTQDPPPTMEEFADAIKGAAEMPDLKALAATEPAEAVRLLESMTDWNGTMPGLIGEEQISWAEALIREMAPQVRWTVLSMHMPVWQGQTHPGLDRIRRALGDHPYTMFAGHVHNYRRAVIAGRDHIRLGPTGGTWVLSGQDGNFDHVAWVTMTNIGPRVANIVLDGVLDVDGGVFNPEQRHPG